MKQQLTQTETDKIETLQQRIRYRFNNLSLLITALTHSSWGNEHGTEHNERLEFLGDAVLEICISTEIFKRFPEEREGVMTKLRSQLVSEKQLFKIGILLGVNEALLIGKGEEAQGGRSRPALVADAVEAIFGAIYLDSGYQASLKIIQDIYSYFWQTLDITPATKDYKTQLQELTQSQLHSLPQYIPLSEEGPDHEKIFRVKLELSNKEFFIAEGKSLKRAEQEAAKLAIEQFFNKEIQ